MLVPLPISCLEWAGDFHYPGKLSAVDRSWSRLTASFLDSPAEQALAADSRRRQAPLRSKVEQVRSTVRDGKVQLMDDRVRAHI
jgi:hypothetical protein